MPEIHVEKYNKGMVDEENNEDVLIDLSTFIMIGVDDRILSTDYTSVEDKMIFDKEWDKTE